MQDAFSIDTGDYMPPVSPDVAAARTVRAQYGLKDIVNVPADDIRTQIQQGQEGTLRSEVASQIDLKKDADLSGQINQVAANPLLPQDQKQQKILGLVQARKPTDPASVFEDTFAVNYTNKIYTVNGKDPAVPKFSWLQDAISIMPVETQQYYDLATEAVAKHVFSRQQEEDAGEIVKQQPYFGSGQTPWTLYGGGYLGDLAKNLSFIYPQAKLRGQVGDRSILDPSVWTDGVTVAQVMDSERLRLYELPYEEFKTEYARIMKGLKEDNPSLAKEFAHGMTGLTTNETVLSNLMEAGGLGVAGEALTLTKYGLRGLEFLNQTKNLAKSMVRSTAALDAHPPAVTAAAGVGDLTEAAVQKATVGALAELSGAPGETKRAFEALTSNFKLDPAEAVSNPGRFGQDLANRIKDIYQTGENSLLNAITTWNRVNRTPIATSTEDIMRSIAEAQKGEFKGMDNAVLDTKGPFHEPASNTYIYEHIIGTPDGEYFKSRATALANAEANGIVIRPTVSGKIADINKQIGQLNRELKVEPNRPQPRVLGELENQAPRELPEAANQNIYSGGSRKTGLLNASDRVNVKFGAEAPAAANENLNAIKALKAQRINSLKEERAALAKQYPDTTKHTSTPLPGTEGFEIKQNDAGAGWYINYTKTLQETSDIVRDSLISTKYDTISSYKKMLFGDEVSTSIPPSRFGNRINAIFGRLRTPEETLSKQERISRRIATATPARVAQLIETNKTAIGQLPYSAYRDFDRVLTYAQHKRDPFTGKPGYFEKGMGDVDGVYRKITGRGATEKEVAAYFEFKKIIEFDRIFREMGNMRNRARAGVETHSVAVLDSEGKKVFSPRFDGIKLDHIPGGEDTLMVMGDKLGEEKFFKANSPELRSRFPNIHKQVIEGERKAIKLWNPEDYPFEGFSDAAKDKKVRYVIAKESKVQPLSWNSINRTGGGHLMPDYQMYIKQPKIDREFVGNSVTDHYHGDTTAYAVADRAVGEAMIRDMNHVQSFLRKGDIDGAKEAYSKAKALPDDWDTYLSKFKGGKGPDGVYRRANFNASHDFQIVPKDRLIIDLDNTIAHNPIYTKPGSNVKFKDGTKSGSDARMAAIEFTGERDAYDLKQITREVGTDGNPVFSLQPARYVDPITTMDRGLSRIINTTVADDYKYFAQEHWLENAKMHIKADQDEIRSAPLYWFHKAEYLPGTPPHIKNNLELQRKKAKDFLGVASDFDNWATDVSQRLSDAAYSATGSSKLALVPVKLWPYVRDPVSLIRSFSYHVTQGLGNINTLFTNAATFGNIYFISPRHAPGGALATMLHNVSYFNKSDEVLNYLDKMASSYNRSALMKVGLRVDWKPGWFKEAMKHLDNSGFGTIRNENAFMSTPENVNILKGLTKNASVARIAEYTSKGMEAGLIPFKIGNTFTRQAAYFTAHLEWRAANPTAAFDRFAKERVLQRADILDHNMSRASNSSVHTGVMSIPFQFEAYSIRLAEMMFGKRLPAMEKARLAAGSMLFYGVRYGPIGAVGIPVAGYLYKKAQDNSLPGQTGPYIPGDKPWSTFVMEGGLTVLASWITGGASVTNPKDSFERGNLYDFSRWGNKSPSTFDTLMASDKTFWDVIGGAPLSKLKDIVNFGSPMVRAFASMMVKDDPNSPKAWHLTSDDLWDAARILASGNKLRQTILAVNTGNWSSKNETIITDGVSKGSAIFMGTTGVNPIEQGDSFSKIEWEREQTKLQKDAANIYIKEYRRAVMASNNKDENAFDTHMKNAWAALNAVDYPSERISALHAMANKGLEAQAASVPETYYTKNLPDARVNDKIQSLGRVQELNQLKGKSN